MLFMWEEGLKQSAGSLVRSHCSRSASLVNPHVVIESLMLRSMVQLRCACCSRCRPSLRQLNICSYLVSRLFDTTKAGQIEGSGVHIHKVFNEVKHLSLPRAKARFSLKRRSLWPFEADMLAAIYFPSLCLMGLNLWLVFRGLLPGVR